MSSSLCISNEPIIFTRYLYNKTEVKQSLFVALLNRKRDEAMFWAYELYFSGFGTDVFDYIINVYREIYSLLNPKLILFIESMLVEWAKDKTRDWTIGSIVTTLVNREYDINNFVNTYFNVKCHENRANRYQKYKFIITLTHADIDPYRTLETGRADTILQRACRFAVNKEYNKLFDTVVPTREVLRDAYYYHWLYYGLDTPVWRQRIFKYKGRLNHEKKTIEFDDEDNLQEFYDKWGYYPEEQPIEVEEKAIGCVYEGRPVSIMEFCMRFEAMPIMKKVKIADSTTSHHVELTNSIQSTD
jgi:hypothetical protein